jgi:hypothetical protein
MERRRLVLVQLSRHIIASSATPPAALDEEDDAQRKEYTQASRPVMYTQVGKQEIGTLGSIQVKAPEGVDEKAIAECKIIIKEMLGQARKDVVEKLIAQETSVAICPQDKYLTALPEYQKFAGKVDSNGNAYASFKVRGLGGVNGTPLTLTSEESLLECDASRVCSHSYERRVQPERPPEVAGDLVGGTEEGDVGRQCAREVVHEEYG